MVSGEHKSGSGRVQEGALGWALGAWEGLGMVRGGHERSELTFSSVFGPSHALNLRCPMFLGPWRWNIGRRNSKSPRPSKGTPVPDGILGIRAVWREPERRVIGTLMPDTCHLSPAASQLSPVTCNWPPVPVTCYLSPVPVTCHLSPVHGHRYLLLVTCHLYLSPATYTCYLYLLPVTCHLYLNT